MRVIHIWKQIGISNKTGGECVLGHFCIFDNVYSKIGQAMSFFPVKYN